MDRFYILHTLLAVRSGKHFEHEAHTNSRFMAAKQYCDLTPRFRRWFVLVVPEKAKGSWESDGPNSNSDQCEQQRDHLIVS